MLVAQSVDPLKQKIHQYTVLSVWGSVTKSLKKGDVVCDVFLGEQHAWVVHNMETGKASGGFRGRYIGTAPNDQPNPQEQHVCCM